ncbi:MAG: 2,3-bisphosphoglycerate-independent phosphoglycerate mutase [Patescibacteria group bacterium]|jgi:2,3-bisphosphoglycerate-independent phosphoglycerate mutase
MSDEIKTKRPKPVVLCVLDGWGVNQPYSGNAITQAKLPNYNALVAHYPSLTLMASGEAVGLPWGEAGNSEVGHLNLGLGKVVYQDLPRINKSISDNSFFENKALLGAVEHARKNGSALHLIGLLSNGGVHASIDHVTALLALARENKFERIFIHAFLDGRDTAYNGGIGFIEELERAINEYGRGKIASLSGRFYAMDRDNHWDRIEKAYSAMVPGRGKTAADPVKAISESYENKIYDEEFLPVVIVDSGGAPVGRVRDNDAVIFFNFRPDRAREITKAFVLPSFDKFSRGPAIKNLFFTCFTEYEKGLPVEIAFSEEPVKNTLGEIISKAGLKQLRIAETEKYAHVTYFFNGGREEKSDGEDHIIIPSPRVDSYDLKPEMSANEVTKKVEEAVRKNFYDFIMVNFANADMVGHTGNLKAAVKAVETIDKCLSRLCRVVLQSGGVIVITADHGNAESMFNMQTGTIEKEHSINPVPLILVGKEFEGKALSGGDAIGSDLTLSRPAGILSDVAPTILKIMGLSKPKEMTGRSLI